MSSELDRAGSEKGRATRVRWGALAASSLAFALLPATFFAVYVEKFGAPRSALLPHAVVVGMVWLLLFALRAALCALPLGRTARASLAAFVIALLLITASAYYALVIVGLASWGRVVSVELMATYVMQAPDLLAALQIPPWLVALAAALALLAVWSLAFAWLRRLDWIAPMLERRSRIFVLLGLALPLSAIAGIGASELEYTGWAKLGEPVTLTLYPAQARSDPEDARASARAAALDRREQSIRSAYRTNPGASTPNVFIIVVDALRADHLSLFGYRRRTTPTLDRLAREGRLAQASICYAVCTASACGLLGIADSRFPGERPKHAFGLPAVLRRHGYTIHMILSGDHTHFYGLRKAYGRVDSYYDGVSQSKFYVNDDRLVLERVKNLGAWQGKPVMFQFHLMSAHLLGKRFADTPSFGPSENYSRIRFLPSGAGARERAINFYDRGVLQTDRVIGELLALLGERGYLRDAVVVITADHGEALGEHDLYTHMNGVLEPQLRVPLVIATFGGAYVAPAPKGALLSQVDIAPTLADAFGMPIPASWEGRPLRSVRAPRVVYFAEKQWRGLVRLDASGRLTKYWTDRRKALEYAYDLSADPGEQRNIAAELPLGEKMRWVKALAGR